MIYVFMFMLGFILGAGGVMIYGMCIINSEIKKEVENEIVD